VSEKGACRVHTAECDCTGQHRQTML
jgi:hypothetical protein